MKFALLAAALSTAVPFAAAAQPAATTTTQLPRNVRPVHYAITLVPDARAATFAGRVAIDIDIASPTARIVLNAADLKFQSATLTRGGATAGNPRVTVDAKAQTATFTFGKPLAAGRYTLDLTYTGVIGTQAAGMFLLDYDTKAGRQRAIYTQFENSDARRVIPSWDEPSYKATFTLTADVPRGQTAVSNMPVASRTAQGDRTRVTFAPSPKMSTYLLFFGLGDFQRITTKAGATEVGVITRAGVAEQARFALESSARVLTEYNDYFGVAFPLPKLDNIAGAGSSQFFGAMENWGAIFSFERVLVLDPSIATQSDKQRVFEVAAHEIAHQWFGDLVTMAWWDDLWLNEGFASWMESRTTAKLNPSWRAELSAVAVRETAISQDALVTTHPVIQKIATVEQASQAFDSITYSKGESVIRMLEAYVGADAWRDGVRRYMKRHAYGNTVSDDLWREMDKGGKPVTQIAHQFTLQPGVPLIRVAVRCVAGNSLVTLTPGQFTRDKAARKAVAWQIPVAVAGSGAPVTTLVGGKPATVTVRGCAPVVVNAGQAGYFRTLYAPADFKRLGAAYAGLKPIDQIGILADSFAQGIVGLQSAADALTLIEKLSIDADPQLWGRVTMIVASLDEYYAGDKARQASFRGYARKLLTPVLARTGWTATPNEAPTVATLRNELITTLGEIGDRAVVAEARRRYAAGATALPAPIRKPVMAVVAVNADAAAWTALRASAKAETTPLVKDQYYTLLARNADPALAKRALDLALTDEPGATNSAAMISQVSALHPELAFDFAVSNRAAVDRRVDSSSRSRYYARLAAGSGDLALIKRLQAYAAANIVAGSRRPVDEAVAGITDRARVRREALPAIDAWLAARAG